MLTITMLVFIEMEFSSSYKKDNIKLALVQTYIKAKTPGISRCFLLKFNYLFNIKKISQQLKTS
ncbi:hypothetical protein EG339_05700 [Chryseobacterium bernardetii]|uniref:Uncharacterized protein n=1 Tax=Chryseobacterium bernardetii TaxID=1241978 RepID=A0A3G6TDI7_9FLAO|nr:hypothetical protein EG339_05700 [Chryseobacterium bernardetii]